MKTNIGDKYNKLKVIDYLGATRYLCKCNCGNIVEVIGSNLRSGNTKSCGCYRKGRCGKHPHTQETKDKISKARKGKLVKENNPAWKGGTTEIKNLQRSEFTRKHKVKIFQRDDYTCHLCNQRGGDLEVHHILWWSLFPLFRFCNWNCITLCKRCHKELHKIR